jgi:glycosyltransferase involved in cell wall biosynthesis
MTSPKVTILMSAYNGIRYLYEALDSICHQTFGDFEFIIVNDGSTDETKELLEDYTDNRITIINNEKNLGLSRSLNIGIEQSRGEYIARMDADDIALPERLSKQMQFLNRYPEIDILGSACYIIDENRTIRGIGKAFAEDSQIKSVICRNSEETPVWHSSAMIRKKALLAAGMYNEGLQSTIDKDLWIRMVIKSFKFANLQEPLIEKLEPQFRPNFEEHRKKHKISRDYVYSVNAEAVALLQKQYGK